MDTAQTPTQTCDTYVRARIDSKTKEQATAALADMGLTLSDAIRLLMVRVATEKAMPFKIKTPNRTTREAIAELEAGKGHKSGSVAEMMAALHADD